MPSMPPMNMGYQLQMPMNQGYPMQMTQSPFGAPPSTKKKVGVFSGFIVPTTVFIAIVVASFYGYTYMKTTSVTQISKAQINNNPTKETASTETETPTTPVDETKTASTPDSTTETNTISTSTAEPKVQLEKVAR